MLKAERPPPRDVLVPRGDIYRDNRWSRSVIQPRIICITIDQPATAPNRRYTAAAALPIRAEIPGRCQVRQDVATIMIV